MDGVRVLALAGVLAVLLLACGCVQIPSSGEQITPSVVTTPPGITLPEAAPEIVPLYRRGDIVDFSPVTGKEPHLIILDYDNRTGSYLYDRIFRQENGSWGYRLYPEPGLASAKSLEKDDPYLITHISIADLETRFPSREIFDNFESHQT
jgi:hypothetical protein